MAIPTVYKSTDSGAPVVIENSPGTALAAIRACLVTGYGSKSSAGWSEPFTGTNEAVFKNSVSDGGTGCHVRVSDTSSAVYCTIEITAYSSMTSISAGSNPTPTRYIFRNPRYSSGNPITWNIVATSKAFWVNFYAPAGGYPGAAGAGDAISFFAGDAYRYFVAGSPVGGNPNPTWINASNGAGSTTDAGLSFAKDHTGIGAAVGYGSLIKWGATMGGSGSPASPSAGAGNVLAPWYLARAAQPLRGRLPGILVPLYDTSGLPFGSVDTSGLAGIGSELLRMTAGYGSPGVWIETALDWGD